MAGILNVLRAALLCAAIVAVVGFIDLEGTARKEVSAILASVKSGAAHFDSASQSLDTAAKDQSAYAREIKKTIADAHDLLIHTDLSVNGTKIHPGLIPTATAVITNQDANLSALEGQATRTIASLDDAVKQTAPILASLSETSRNLSELAADPEIKDTLARLDHSIEQTNEILANLDAIAASGNRDAQMVETRLRQALKPATLAQRAFRGLLGIAGPASQIATAAKP